MIATLKNFLFAAGLCSAAMILSSSASAQAPVQEFESDGMELFDSPSPSAERTPQASHIPSPAQLRQALAWHQRLQRVARTEEALRRGYHLSRPPGIVTPSTTSRYPYYHTIIIPVYVDNLRR